MTQIDFPFVRSSLICPLCRRGKDAGTICCWSCYGEQRMRDGNKEAEDIIADADANLRRRNQSALQEQLA